MDEQINDDLQSQETELTSEIDILHEEIEALLGLVEGKQAQLMDIRKQISQADKKHSVAAQIKYRDVAVLTG